MTTDAAAPSIPRTQRQSSEIAISVRELSKAYTIRHSDREKHSTLAETMLHLIRSPRSAFDASKETFWALDDVSFDIRKGDVVGVIGRNGAGKSTLLKVLSRITEPTAGEIDLYGRVGSLLEVGTGFHPELTGRENIYLNGAILGMSKAEIRQQFDAIVDFAGIDKFLDTPVKRYSSGMYVRLGFAVAAHLESEILIVDEVLSVGDSEFQQKCLGKMRDVASGGRTVLFVSHHMQSVSVLCNRALFLENGHCVYSGSVPEAIRRYSDGFKQRTIAEHGLRQRPGSGELRFMDVSPIHASFSCAEVKGLSFTIRRVKPYSGKYFISCNLQDSQGFTILHCDSRVLGQWFDSTEQTEGSFSVTTPWLKPGTYRASLFICCAGAIIDRFEDACDIHVTSVLPYKGSIGMEAMGLSVVCPDFAFSAQPQSLCSDAGVLEDAADCFDQHDTAHSVNPKLSQPHG